MNRRSALYLLAVGALGITACSDKADSPTSPVAPTMDAIASSMSASVAGNYLIKFSSGVPAGFQQRVAQLGGQVMFAHNEAGVGAVSGMTDATALQLSKLSGVQGVSIDDYVELDPGFGTETESVDIPESPSNPATAAFYARQWHMRPINASAAWTAGQLGAGRRIGVLDTGLGYNHADLNGRVDLVASRSFLPAEDARVQAAFPGANNIADLHYHGTHVGATIASNGLAAAGVTSGATLVGMKVCGAGTAANGWRGSCPTSATFAAILYAADIGLDAINMSLGGTFNRRDATPAIERQYDPLYKGPSFIAVINQVMSYANRKGVTVVVSAGNSNLDMDHDKNGYKTYCSAPTVICVSATGPTAGALNGPWTDIDAKAPYSNYGASAVSVAAPGGNFRPVWAACSRFSLAIPVCQTGTFIVGISGTSMAAPHVTGLAALVINQVGRSPGTVRDVIQSTADDLGVVGTDPIYGKGRINVRAALGL